MGYTTFFQPVWPTLPRKAPKPTSLASKSPHSHQSEETATVKNYRHMVLHDSTIQGAGIGVFAHSWSVCAGMLQSILYIYYILLLLYFNLMNVGQSAKAKEKNRAI